MIENLGDAQVTKAHHIQSRFASAKHSTISVERLLCRVVGDLYTQRTTDPDAVRKFRVRYIVGVLIKHAFHLGRVAEELGMHRNTLTRTIRELEINWKRLREIRPVSCDAKNHRGPVTCCVLFQPSKA